MPRTKSVVAGVVRTLNVTVADVLYAYAVTGSAFATLMVLARRAAPGVFVRCVFHGKGDTTALGQPLDRTEADTGGRLHRGLHPSIRRQCPGSSTSTSYGGDMRGCYLAVRVVSAAWHSSL